MYLRARPLGMSRYREIASYEEERASGRPYHIVRLGARYLFLKMAHPPLKGKANAPDAPLYTFLVSLRVGIFTETSN